MVLLILAGVTINLLFGDTGIIKRAQDAQNAWENAEKTDQEGIGNLADQMDNVLNSIGGGSSENTPVDIDTIIAKNDYVAQNTTVTDENGESLTVPKNFKVTNDSNEVKKGVVIEDKQGNQFVWVPVPDVTTMYETQNGEKVGKLYDFSTTGYTARIYPGKNISYREPDIVTGNRTGTGSEYDGNPTNLSILGLSSSSEFAAQLQNEFNQMIASVERYKGFYIGRYETGNLAENTTTTPAVKKGQTAISNVTWYYQYQNSKKIAEGNEAVTSSMIWGSQWDATLRWMYDSSDNAVKTFVTDSTGKGNYTGSIAATGSSEDYKVNNIYDMAGNVSDWTIEAYDTNYRGYHRRLLWKFRI